jgi:hypothetical protein
MVLAFLNLSVFMAYRVAPFLSTEKKSASDLFLDVIVFIVIIAAISYIVKVFRN